MAVQTLEYFTVIFKKDVVNFRFLTNQNANKKNKIVTFSNSIHPFKKQQHDLHK